MNATQPESKKLTPRNRKERQQHAPDATNRELDPTVPTTRSRRQEINISQKEEPRAFYSHLEGTRNRRLEGTRN